MHIPDQIPDPLRSAKSGGGKWLFRGVMAALLAVVLLPLLSLALYGWRVNQQRAIVERIGNLRSWRIDTITTFENAPAGRNPGEQPWIVRVLGEEWQLPKTEGVFLEQPFAANLRSNLEEIAGLARFETLKLSGGPFSDEDLQGLARLRLKRLDLDATDITDAGVETLVRWPRLERLDLSATAISDRGIDAISRMNTLKFVRLRHTAVTVAKVKKLQRLRPDLEIEYAPVKNSKQGGVVRAVTKRGGIVFDKNDRTWLVLDGRIHQGDWSGFDWSTLKEISDVHEIDVWNFERPEEVLVALADMPNLRDLRIGDGNVPLEFIERIARCRDLERLSLTECGLQPSHIQPLTRLTKLKHLTLSDVPVGRADLSAIAALPKLEHLFLNRCNLTDDDVLDIARCESLKELMLSENREITDASVDTLLMLPRLELAVVGGTGISDSGIQRLTAAVRQRREASTAAPAQ